MAVIDYSADLESYTPENLRRLAKQIEDLRCKFLFGLDDAGSDSESEQHYLLALSAMEQAHRFMSLAAIKQSQNIC